MPLNGTVFTRGFDARASTGLTILSTRLTFHADRCPSRLDDFWIFQDVKYEYDYTVDLITAEPEIDLSMILKINEKL